MDYYTIHDEENNRLGFAPHNASNKSPLEKGTQPTRAFGSGDPPQKETSIWTWVVSIILVLAFAAFWGAAITKVNRDNNKGKKGSKMSDDDKKTMIIWSIVALVSTCIFGFLIFAFFFPWFNNAIVDDVKGSYEGNEILVAGSAIGLFAAYASRKESSETSE